MYSITCVIPKKLAWHYLNSIRLYAIIIDKVLHGKNFKENIKQNLRKKSMY